MSTAEQTAAPAPQQQGALIAKPNRTPVSMGSRGVVLTSLDDLWRFANYVAASGLAPKNMERPEAIMVAVQMGLEVGLSPMTAVQNIAVINGRPGIYGDVALALCESARDDSGASVIEEFVEWYQVGGKQVDRLTSYPDDAMACCSIKRRGRGKPILSIFSVQDAKLAGLWGKAGPWTQYPWRMLRWRARGFGLRDACPDVLRGIRTAEELEDIPPAIRLEVPEQAQISGPHATTSDRLVEQLGGNSEPASVAADLRREDTAAVAAPNPEKPPEAKTEEKAAASRTTGRQSLPF